METYIQPRELVENPQYLEQRQKCLAELGLVDIDTPIIELIKDFNTLPYCFTLQSCYGHFLYNAQRDPRNLDPLPVTDAITDVQYRIAYVAFCIENSDSGRKFLDALKNIPSIDSENIQFCSAEWFWKKYLNSYALQVEPDRFKHKDTAVIDYTEALKIEKIRNEFFVRLKELVTSYLNR